MSFSITKTELFDLLQMAYPVAPVKSSLQILSNLKLVCRADSLEVTATDLDHSICATGKVTKGDDFEIAVNARKIYDVIREVPEGEISGEVEENVLTLRSERGFSCRIAGADPSDFPAFPEVDDGSPVTVTVSDLSRMISRSVFAVSKDTSRSCLCGVLWEVESKKSLMIATDGHRLGCCSVEGKYGAKSKLSAIVSPKSLVHIMRICDEKEGRDIQVAIGEKYALFSTERFRLCSKLLEGPYPDYEKVIPKSNPKKVVVDKQLLADAVRRVSILSNQKTHLVKFSFTKSELEVAVLNRDIGAEAREVVPVSYDGDEHSIGFNAQYFTEILNIVDVPTVRLEMNTQISACVVFAVTDEKEKPSEDLFLIMPLRIMES